MLSFRLCTEPDVVIHPDVLNTAVSLIWGKSSSASGLYWLKGEVGSSCLMIFPLALWDSSELLWFWMLFQTRGAPSMNPEIGAVW